MNIEMTESGSKLIFLISQPRSGSTLVQRILGSHPEIHTQSEPWILLHPLHVFKHNNLMSVYKSDISANATMDFINHLPGGMSEYKASIAGVYAGFYDSILRKNEKSLFLDKTPRYYHIIKELYDYFPEAKFIFLFRNPAAVIVSIANTWIKGNWYYLNEYKEDLLEAPSMLVEGVKELGEHAYSIRYEDFLSEPEINVQKLCEYIGVAYDNKMLEFSRPMPKKFKYGDKGASFEKSIIDLLHIDHWKASLCSPQLFRIVDEYISMLDSKTISKMGYSKATIKEHLHKHKPNLDIEKSSVGLNSFFQNTRELMLDNKRLAAQANILKTRLNQLDNINNEL